MPGCGFTTVSGPTTASAGCRRSCFCRGLHQPASLLWNCLLDGEAYVRDWTQWSRPKRLRSSFPLSVVLRFAFTRGRSTLMAAVARKAWLGAALNYFVSGLNIHELAVVR